MSSLADGHTKTDCRSSDLMSKKCGEDNTESFDGFCDCTTSIRSQNGITLADLGKRRLRLGERSFSTAHSGFRERNRSQRSKSEDMRRHWAKTHWSWVYTLIIIPGFYNLPENMAIKKPHIDAWPNKLENV